jgi:DNA helicase HerA-like ATPase
VAAAARTFRPNPAFKTEEVITQLAIGEALVSFLEPSGTPGMVERAMILPPEARAGAVTPEERRAAIAASRLAGRYDAAVDRESAYELLTRRFEQTREAAEAAQQAKEGARQAKERAKEDARQAKEEAARAREADRQAKREARENPNILGSIARQATLTIGREVGRSILRGVLGGLFGGRKK